MARTSKIRICKGIKLDKEYNNVLNYTESNMLSLCESNTHLVASANDYSFIRARGTISVNFTYSQCLQSNYMAFQNKDYDNKWFFAFIDDVTYISDGCTEISYTIDAWSTWFPSLNIENCFVVREHTNDDTIGANTIPENLDVGEVIEEDSVTDSSYSNATGYWVAVMSDYRIKDNSTGNEIDPTNRGLQCAGISLYNNCIYGSELFLFNILTTSNLTDLALFLQRTASDGHASDINAIYVLPSMSFSSLANFTQHTASAGGISFSFYTIPYTTTPKTFDTTVNKLTSFTGVTIRNNKCYCYPYNYILASNNQGSTNIYKYENFSSASCVFENQFSINVGGSGRVVPKSYKGMSYAEDEAIPLGKYPTCAWSCDAFTNWLTQNSVNIAVSAGLTAGSLAGGIITAGGGFSGEGLSLANEISTANQASLVANSGMSVASGVGGLIGQFYQASLMPNIKGGQATGDVIWSVGLNGFVFRKMRCKDEYIKVIDEYFSRFRL